MVFHSVDKMTSLFVHLNAPLMLYGMRHKWSGNYVLPDPDTTTFSQMFIGPLAVYLVWQFLYWLKVYVYSKEKSDRVTSARWLLDSKKGFIYNLAIKPFGPAYADYGFMLLQLLYTMVVLLPGWLLYQYDWLCLLFILFVGAASIWNGAGYYFEVFVTRYERMLKEAEQKNN
eukprot:TRINITY_DN1395_c0_g1_i1.p2 TRINITY_DN1395_c0_g1~~TRINITY_DN1395_c0_g1_i1.p2  ORF type:complete len:172 (-),score=13.12 TRINITY_DN1395_c0_g1_i1:28-543(-)